MISEFPDDLTLI